MPENGNIVLLHDILDRAALLFPQKVAIVHDEGSVSYAQLAGETVKLAGWFEHMGCQRGDRIALLLPNSIPLVTAIIAASRIGAIFFVIDISVKAYNLQHIIEDGAPTLIVATRQRRNEDQLDRYCPVFVLEDDWSHMLQSENTFDKPSLISQDIACLIYTSGSTGRPKAIICRHANMIFAVAAIQKSLSYQETDVIGNFLPMAFDVGLYQVFLCFQVGATLALGQNRDVGPGFLKKLRDWHVTGLPAVPGLVSLLVSLSKRDVSRLPSLRFVTNTGAYLSDVTIDEVQKFYPACRIYVMFGLTECKRVSILSPLDYKQKSGSVGKPLWDTECFIVDAEGQVLAPGEVGELVVRGPHVMPGYWRAPEMTAQRFRVWGSGYERVLFTGDICRLDEEGYLYFIGRTDDIYKQEDHRVSSLEIEVAACDIPGIQQAALIPPHATRGAVLFVKGEITSREEVRTELQKRLEDYKLPPHIIVRDEICLTANGKVDKNQLRQLLSEKGYVS